MRYLDRLLTAFVGLFRKVTARFNGSASQAERADLPLARFLYSDRSFSTTSVRTSGFMPHKVRLDCSVSRTDDLSVEETAELGRKARPTATLRAWGQFLSRHVAEASEDLRLDMDETPPRHGNILGWPANKDDQKAIAVEFTQRAQLMMVPD